MGLLNKPNILSATNGGRDVFAHYISDFKNEGKTFKAVFREDKNPSANVYRGSDGGYLYKDFADGNATNAIDFVMKLRGCTFYEALKCINSDLKLGLTEAKAEVSSIVKGTHSEYWRQYATKDIAPILEKYNVFPIKEYVTKKGYKVICSKENPAFGFQLGSNYTKIYKPLEQTNKFKHQFLGEQPVSYIPIFGLAQLPEYCKVILIVEGFKDCVVANANLNNDDIFAVGLDNVSTRIPTETLQLLREKCDELVLCLDIDEAGMKHAKVKSLQHGLKILTLPNILTTCSGKDISDWFKLKLDKTLLLNELEKVLASPVPTSQLIETTSVSKILKVLLAQEHDLLERAKAPIVYSEPLISMNDTPVIRKGTINIIQGKFGSHKSRLGELLCSLLTTDLANCNSNFLSFTKSKESVTVAYIDTERNKKEELPTAIQAILLKACCNEQVPANFRVTSIKEIERQKRLEAIKEFIEELRRGSKNPLFVLLDVVTDCVADFNSAGESMKLFDYLGNLCDKYDATFLLIIHQNPNTDKARGHTGTEAANKASTVMQIGYERGRNNVDSDIIALKFLKLRTAKRPEPVYLIFDEKEHGLAFASPDVANAILCERRQVAAIDDVAEKLGELLKPSLNQHDLIKQLQKDFTCSENTLKTRLKEIEAQQVEITNERDRPCTLEIKSVAGAKTIYELKESDYQLDGFQF